MPKNESEFFFSATAEHSDENGKYKSFKDLPQEVVERLRVRLVEGDDKFQMRRNWQEHPEYTEKELQKIIEAFEIFNQAVQRGLPNELYRMFARQLDVDLVRIATKLNAIWYAHEGAEEAKAHIQAFADGIKGEIDERKDWDGCQFDKEYFIKYWDVEC